MYTTLPRLLVLILAIAASLWVAAALSACGESAAAERSGHPVLRIAAASALRPIMEDLVAGYVQEHGAVEAIVTFGASGKLYAQIASRGPFDVFLASDCDYPRALVTAGLTHGEAVHYASGPLVLWMPHDSPVAGSTDAGRALGDPALRRVAIASPRHAPYGRAAMQVLEGLGLEEQLAQRLVIGENVEQAAQFAHVGAADAALVAATLTNLPAMQAGRTLALPEAAGVKHCAVVLESARDQARAAHFAEFLLTPTAQAILQRYGLEAADGGDG